MSLVPPEHPHAKIIKWRKEHPDIVKSYNAKYYAANRDRIKQQKRERYQLKKQQYDEALRVYSEQVKIANENNKSLESEKIVNAVDGGGVLTEPEMKENIVSDADVSSTIIDASQIIINKNTDMDDGIS
jgi:hypothetical protein